MSLLCLLFNPFSDIITICVTLLLIIVVCYLVQLYLLVYKMPPGPLPLPIVGNTLSFLSKDHWNTVMKRQIQKYGPVFTFWIGRYPFVVISDPDIANHIYNKNEFSGKTQTFIGTLFSNKKHQDVEWTDHGPIWEALRKVTLSAVHKYSTNDKLVSLVIDCVDTTVKQIIEKESINKAFDPKSYLNLLFLNIFANSAFGKKYSKEDKEVKKFQYILKGFTRKRFQFATHTPLYRIMFCKSLYDFKVSMNSLIKLLNKYFMNHYKHYEESNERDFCDALITAKNEVLKVDKESTNYLSDTNLSMCVFDLFFEGILTLELTFKWILLFIGYYPEIQKKLRQDIEINIGDRIATHEDRNQCHYVMAFILEILRFRNIYPTGTTHKAIVETKIGDYRIPKESGLFVYQGMILTDEKYWPKTHEFRPERFLENQQLIKDLPKAFIPFGVGRRSCLGEKLAIDFLFLILVRFIQNTNDYRIVLGINNGIDADVNVDFVLSPYDFEIMFLSK